MSLTLGHQTGLIKDPPPPSVCNSCFKHKHEELKNNTLRHSAHVTVSYLLSFTIAGTLCIAEGEVSRGSHKANAR